MTTPGIVGISPAPAKLETDCMTGNEVGWSPTCCCCCGCGCCGWAPFHWIATDVGSLLLWKLKQLTELKIFGTF